VPPARALGVAQTIPVRGDVDANVAEHARLARVAAREGARVLVFPELSLTGYELDLARDAAFSENDPRLVPLVDLASSCSMTVIVGAPVGIGSRRHIGAFIVAPDRGVRLYTKHHLGAFPPSASCDGMVPPPEATVFEAGDRNPLVSLDGGTAAVAVCGDAARPSHPEEAAARGATTYLASVFIIPSQFASEAGNLALHAVRRVAMANYGGPSGGLASAGRSTIWSERGERLVELDPSGAGVGVAIERAGGWHCRAVMGYCRAR